MTSFLLSQLYSRTTVQVADIAYKPINSKIHRPLHHHKARTQGELTAWSIHREPWRTCVCTMRMRVIRRKNGRPNVWPSKGGITRSRQWRGFRENATNFLTLQAEHIQNTRKCPTINFGLLTCSQCYTWCTDAAHAHTHTNTHTHTHTHKQSSTVFCPLT